MKTHETSASPSVGPLSPDANHWLPRPSCKCRHFPPLSPVMTRGHARTMARRTIEKGGCLHTPNGAPERRKGLSVPSLHSWETKRTLSTARWATCIEETTTTSSPQAVGILILGLSFPLQIALLPLSPESPRQVYLHNYPWPLL